jgi:hypothetical protein
MGLLVKLLQSKGWMKPDQASVLASLRHLPADVQDDVAQQVVRVFGAMKSVPKNDPRHALLSTQLDELMHPEKMVGGTPTAMDRADAMFPVVAYSGRSRPLELDPDVVLRGRGLNPDSSKSADGVNRKLIRFFSEDPETAKTYVPHASYGAHTIPARLNLGKNLRVEADGEKWSDLTADMVPDEDVVKTALGGSHYHDDLLSTDAIARAAAKNDYDSVTFMNIRDQAETDWRTPRDTVHAMLNQSGIRAKTAKFSPYDKRKYDILASVLATGGLGGGLLALSKRSQQREAA